VRKRILLVDDEPAIQRLVSITLGTADFDVVIAGDGEVAVQTALAQPPDLILLDVALPERDGFSVAGILRANPRTAHIPIVMLTARGSPEDKAQGKALGVEHYFVKPFSPLQLLSAIYEFLDAEQMVSRHLPARKIG